MAYSILIKNGTILDGTGKAPYLTDIGITDDKIKDIGDLSEESALEIIDAKDLYVSPGFIDLTNHSDTYGSIFSMPSQESLLMQGITTILMGNCGESLAPISKKEELSELDIWKQISSLNVDWNSISEYYRRLEEISIGVNAGTLIGLNTLLRGSNNIEEALLLLNRGLEEGAWGMSANLSVINSMPRENLLRLLSIVKKHNTLFKIHLADEGRNLLPSVSQAITLARESGARTVISHFKAIGRVAWKDFDKALNMIKNAKSEGAEIYFDVFPYLRTGSMLLSFLPQWARFGATNIILQNLENLEFKNKLLASLKKATLHADRITIASAGVDKNVVGETLAEVAAKTGFAPEEAIVELLKINHLNVNVFGQTLKGKNLFSTLRTDGVVLSSDGAGYNVDARLTGDLIHPRSFGAHARFFNSISGRAGLSIEEAVRLMTFLPAQIFGLHNRGIIQKNYIADLTIFHPEGFKDMATYKNPFQYASGMKFVVLDGKIIIRDGDFQNIKAGKILRKRVS